MTRISIVCLSVLGLGTCSSTAPGQPPPTADPDQGVASECARLAKSYKSSNQTLIDQLKADARRSLSKRPGMTIEDVLWVGTGEYELLCGGRYPAAEPKAPGKDPGVDKSFIEGWSRGGGTADEPGTYTFDNSLTVQTIREYQATKENLARFGARLTHGGEQPTRATFARESVLAVYDYKDNYFSDWVMRAGPLAGSRIERHPVDHLVTLIRPSDADAPSYFILGRVLEDGKLELGAIRLEVGVTVLIPANTVHTNDYVKGTLEEIYPRVWGIDEVLLVNREGKRVVLAPEP